MYRLSDKCTRQYCQYDFESIGACEICGKEVCSYCENIEETFSWCEGPHSTEPNNICGQFCDECRIDDYFIYSCFECGDFVAKKECQDKHLENHTFCGNCFKTICFAKGDDFLCSDDHCTDCCDLSCESNENMEHEYYEHSYYGEDSEADDIY